MGVMLAVRPYKRLRRVSDVTLVQWGVLQCKRNLMERRKIRDNLALLAFSRVV